jgi:hypothetical protein
MRVRSPSTADTVAVDMATHSTMTETCLQAMVHIAELETISFLHRNLAETARFLTMAQLRRIPGAEYQLQ